MLILRMLFKPSFLLLLVAITLNIKFIHGNPGNKYVIDFRMFRNDQFARKYLLKIRKFNEILYESILSQ